MLLPNDDGAWLRHSLRDALGDARELPAGARRVQEQVFWAGPRGPRDARVMPLRPRRPDNEEA